MTISIGCGSGGAPELVGPAQALAEHGNVSYLCFEALAERTLTQGVQASRSGNSSGYCERLAARSSGATGRRVPTG
ncbi:MAG: acyclic terpene utilization AtuA family protein [Gemmobacter sp.]|nr:acyclic terpene utilization AtuA family protein [Gemmobacter sp.]